MNVSIEVQRSAEAVLNTQIVSMKRLTEGLINYTFRASTKENNVIIKYTPPFIASIPEIELSVSRSFFEQQALKQVPSLVDICRTPRLLASRDTLTIIEDKGCLNHLGQT